MSQIGQIERTGRKRRRKRLILVLATMGALGLGGLTMFALAQSGSASSRHRASLSAADPAPQGPVTEDEAEQALIEAEAMQVLVSDLGTAVVDAGIADMAPLESLLTQAVDVAAAADEMCDAVDLGAENAARGARTRFHAGVRGGEAAVEAVLQQLRSRGVDVAALRRPASE